MAAKVTIADIARHVSLSSTTVSFVLNNRQDKGISEKTRALVISAACELGYRKVTKNVLSDYTRVAFVTPNIEFFNFHTSFFAGVYHHLQGQAFKNKIEPFLLELAPSRDLEQVFLRLDEIRSLGIEVCMTYNHEVERFLRENGFKTILVQSGVIAECVCVYCDDYAAGKLAAEHAWEMGHRRAGFIFPGNYRHPRYSGFFDTFTALGGDCPKQYQWTFQSDHETMVEKICEKAAEKPLPSFFYCFADNVMFPAIRAFSKIGLSVPDDISLIGADNLYWGKIATPAFTTVDLCEKLFSEKLIEAIKHVKKSKDVYQLAVPVRLISRETVRRIHNPANL